MKNSTFFLFLLSLLAFSACVDDGPDVDPEFTLLQHDDANQDAPELPTGTYEGGARFLASQMAALSGDKLIEVQYYLKDRPSSGSIRIYQGSEGDKPKTLVYNENVSIGEEEKSWNTHSLKTALVLDGSDLWINYRFTQATNQRTLGCDIGPAVENGDWLWDANDDQWLPLRQRSTISINWNVRGVVEPK